MQSEKTFASRIAATYQTIRGSTAVQKINAFLLSPWGLATLAACTLCAFSFQLELVFYTLVGFLAIYVSLFGEDFTPMMSPFVFCYVTAGASNNPGKTETSFFYSGGVYILVLVGIAFLCMFARMALDKSLGFKRLFTKKRSLLLGMLILTLAYCLSGILRADYKDVAWSNLRFVFLQFLSIVFLYFFFSATIKWNEHSGRYFAWLGAIMGVLISLEVCVVYLQMDVIVDGVIYRDRIDTGWGCYNNVGAMITMSIPFAFYLACKSKRPYFFLLLGTGLLGGVVLSCSRGSMVGGAVVYVLSWVYAFLYADNKKAFRISSYVLAGVAIVTLLCCWVPLEKLFSDVPDIVNSETSTDNVEFNDSGRLDIYKNGLQVFLNNPIFGESFFPQNYAPWEYAETQQVTSLIPPRWHNTIVQLLASCGIVGILAYGFHRYQTVKLIWKKRTRLNIYIAISIIGLLVMSLLDCHFFNLGPILFYSMALAVAEFADDDYPLKKTVE